MSASISEERGIASLSEEDLRIYSVGISTGGIAEMRMAKENPERRIIATTIDTEGALFAQKRIQQSELEQQIEVKVEDVALPLTYPDNYFDFIYARLVLHYLPRSQLMLALCELQRVLRARGKIFVVVRSDKCPEVKDKKSQLNPETGMTHYTSNGCSYSRYFHSEQSIAQYLKEAGFTIEHVTSYEEQLCVDFQRLQPASQVDDLIEVLATK